MLVSSSSRAEPMRGIEFPPTYGSSGKLSSKQQGGGGGGGRGGGSELYIYTYIYIPTSGLIYIYIYVLALSHIFETAQEQGRPSLLSAIMLSLVSRFMDAANLQSGTHRLVRLLWK